MKTPVKQDLNLAGTTVYFWVVRIIEIQQSFIRCLLLKNKLRMNGSFESLFSSPTTSSSTMRTLLRFCICYFISYIFSYIQIGERTSIELSLFSYNSLNFDGVINRILSNFLKYRSWLVISSLIKCDLPLPGFPIRQKQKWEGVILGNLSPLTPSFLLMSGCFIIG